VTTTGWGARKRRQVLSYRWSEKRAAERGWAVFPCRAGDKRPTVRDWEGLIARLIELGAADRSEMRI
jgi:Bifunctional DNA primase/polymerase, N-terminal